MTSLPERTRPKKIQIWSEHDRLDNFRTWYYVCGKCIPGYPVQFYVSSARGAAESWESARNIALSHVRAYHRR